MQPKLTVQTTNAPWPSIIVEGEDTGVSTHNVLERLRASKVYLSPHGKHVLVALPNSDRWYVEPQTGGLVKQSQDLREAQQELSEVPTDAEEDGLDVPSRLALENAGQLLVQMYRLSPRKYVIYPVSGGYVAIDARGEKGIAVIMCGSDGEVLCLATINSRERRSRYSDATDLPDGFIREALSALGAPQQHDEC